MLLSSLDVLWELGLPVQISTASALACGVAFLSLAVRAKGDRRRLDHEGVWAKPLKFAASAALLYATFGVTVAFLGPAWRMSALLGGVLAASSAAGVFEIGYISLQASRGRRSHFNTDTPTEARLYGLMAVAAAVVLSPAAVLGYAAAVDEAASWSTPVRIGFAGGLLGSTLLTVVTAYRLGSNGSHFVGAEPAEPDPMPVTGWSRTAPDLRPSHFLATHMMQAVPLAAAVASTTLPTPAAVAVVLAFALLWSVLTIAVFAAALSGRCLDQAVYRRARDP